MDRRRYEPEPPTFAQTVVIIQTMPRHEQQDLEAIKLRHVALGFQYPNDQIHRALAALNLRVRRWDRSNRRSARST